MAASAVVTSLPASEFVRGRPTAALAAFVVEYSGYREAGVAPALHRGLPSPWLTLIVTLDDPLSLLDDPGDPTRRRDFGALIGGLHTTPALVHHDGHQSGIQVALRPLGARALLGLPAGELGRLDLHAHEILGRGVDGLRDRLRSVSSWDVRFALLDTFLTARIRSAAPPAPEVAHAWDLLIRSRGTVSVDAVGREVGWSPRHLRERVRLETGLSPKSLARVIRFDRARRLLRTGAAVTAGTGPSAADVAARCGYADQSHLTRDFRDLAGTTPTAWLRDEGRFVQDADGRGAAGCQP